MDKNSAARKDGVVLLNGERKGGKPQNTQKRRYAQDDEIFRNHKKHKTHKNVLLRRRTMGQRDGV
jgi:hypothetical protein